MVTEANSINSSATGIVGNTGTAFVSTSATAHNVILGGSTTSTLTNVAPSATSGVPLVSNGAAADPSFTTAVVAGGGTGQVTLTSHGVLVGAGTSAITQLGAGTSGQVLQSGGAGADPAYSTATYPATAGTSGNIIKSDGTNFTSSSPAGAGSSLFLISSQTASGSASITFTSGLTYNSYLLLFWGIQLASNGHDVELQLSTNGGSTYIATNYQSGAPAVGYNSNTFNGANSTTYIILVSNAQNTITGNGWIILESMSNSASMMSSGMGSNLGGGTMNIQLNQATNTGTGTYNALKILAASGNLTVGTFTLYGIKES